MKFASRKGFIDRESYVAQYIALSLMSIGLTGLLGSDDLLAAFAAGQSNANQAFCGFTKIYDRVRYFMGWTF